jgi:N-acetylglucosamine malate deacetylase 1
MKKIMVIAPHPDDETLGCGGSLLKHIDNGDQVFWLIATTNKDMKDITSEQVDSRKEEINHVAKEYNFTDVFQLDLPSTLLDTIPMLEIISSIGEILTSIKPEIIYIPYRYDAHSDHKVIFDCSIACTKPFRYPFLKTVRVYQTLSETEFSLTPEQKAFKPNLFIDISNYLERKIEIMNLYSGEILSHPFPRSHESIRAQSTLNGSIANCKYAESFITLRDIE